jgi:hypothetical protein
MKISTNNILIERNKKISQVVLYTSLALLTLGLLWSIKDSDKSQTTFAYVILIPAYILVQVSIYMANRWGRSPRPDEILVSSLKGLNNQYSLYNFTTGVPHLLVGPSGIFIIKPYYHTGEISYNPDKKRYEQKGGPGLISKLFAQESIPSIEREAKNVLDDYHRYLTENKISIGVEPEVINFFYAEKVDIRTKNAPEINLQADKLKDYLRQAAKKSSLTDVELKKITDQLPKETE